MKKGINLNSIIRMALSIIDHEGVEQLTIRKVADGLGIKPPSLYNHVESLNQILDYCAQESLVSLHGIISDLLNNQVSPRHSLSNVGFAYRNFAKKFPGKYTLTQTPAFWESEESNLKAEEIVNSLINITRDSNMAEDDQIHFIRNFRSYLHGFITLEINHSFQMEQDVEKSFEKGLEIFTRVLNE